MNLIKGKKVGQAETELSFKVKRASDPLKTLLKSAIANAVNQTGAREDELIVSNIRVDKGVVMKRSMPRAFGRASRINKRTSNVTITLAQAVEKPSKKSKSVTVEKKK